MHHRRVRRQQAAWAEALDRLQRPAGAALAVEHLPAKRGGVALAEADATLPTNLRDLMWVMHSSPRPYLSGPANTTATRARLAGLGSSICPKPKNRKDTQDGAVWQGPCPRCEQNRKKRRQGPFQRTGDSLFA